MRTLNMLRQLQTEILFCLKFKKWFVLPSCQKVIYHVRLLAEKDTENTKKATKVAINLFRSYLQEKGLTETEILTSKIKLATVLQKFYPEARKQDGNYYTTASLTAICFSLR